MNFSEKLKKAAKELNLTQVQMAGMTGKSKASISQYLAGKQIPPEEQQRDIAVALGLKEDYFSKADDRMPRRFRHRKRKIALSRV